MALASCLVAPFIGLSPLALQKPRTIAALVVREHRRSCGTLLAADQGAERVVRVSVRNSQLLASTATAKKVQTEDPSALNINLGGVQIWPKPQGSVIGLFVLMLALVRKAIIKGGFRKAFLEMADSRYLASSKQEEAELHEFQCEKCSFTIFPARGREGKFFPDDYKCQSCGAPKEAFFDMNSLDDPRAIEARANDPDFVYTTEQIELDAPAPPPMPPPPPPRRLHSRRRCRRRLPSRRHRCRHPRFHRPRRAPRHRQDRRPCTTAAAPSGTSHNPPTLAPAYTAASLPQTCARTAAVGTRVTGTAKSAVSSAKSPAAARQRLAAGCRTVACGGRAASLAHQAGGGGIWRCHGYV